MIPAAESQFFTAATGHAIEPRQTAATAPAPSWSVFGRGLIGKRDRALLLLGFALAARRSELVALEVADLEECPEGFRVTIRRSLPATIASTLSEVAADFFTGATPSVLRASRIT
jgi:hypothetical protein